MRTKIFRNCSAILLLLLTQLAYAGDVFVISNSGLGATISADDVKDIFLGEKQFIASTKLDIIDNSAVQNDFLSKFLHIDAVKYHAIWTKKSFRDGLIPPAVKSGDAEVIEYVKKTPGAIGYVSTKPAGVRVVQ